MRLTFVYSAERLENRNVHLVGACVAGELAAIHRANESAYSCPYYAHPTRELE